MSAVYKVLLGVLAFVATISGLHVWLNIGWDRLLAGRTDENFRVGFLPVT